MSIINLDSFSQQVLYGDNKNISCIFHLNGECAKDDCEYSHDYQSDLNFMPETTHSSNKHTGQLTLGMLGAFTLGETDEIAATARCSAAASVARLVAYKKKTSSKSKN